MCDQNLFYGFKKKIIYFFIFLGNPFYKLRDESLAVVKVTEKHYKNEGGGECQKASKKQKIVT